MRALWISLEHTRVSPVVQPVLEAGDGPATHTSEEFHSYSTTLTKFPSDEVAVPDWPLLDPAGEKRPLKVCLVPLTWGKPLQPLWGYSGPSQKNEWLRSKQPGVRIPGQAGTIRYCISHRECCGQTPLPEQEEQRPKNISLVWPCLCRGPHSTPAHKPVSF